MGFFARIENDMAAEVAEFDGIEGRFHPSLVWVECPAGTLPGDLYDGETGQFSRPAVVPRPITEADIAARRYQAEIAGTTFNGWPIHTDRESQAKIGNAYALARDGYWPAGSGWKFVDGWRELTVEQIVGCALAVAAHVQTCFAIEAQKVVALKAGQNPQLDEGWPA